MFELVQLEQLLAIAKYDTLSKASEELLISQPALSRSMQRLEDELQVPLFNRQKNKITFNENGKIALDYAKRVLDICNDKSSTNIGKESTYYQYWFLCSSPHVGFG